MIDLLKPMDLNCSVFQVYNDNEYTIEKVLCNFFTKINEIANSQNKIFKLSDWLVNQGLKEEVAKQLYQWYLDGTLKDIIGESVFNDLHDKIENTTELSNNNYLKISNIIKGLPYINVKYPILGIEPCKCDGEFDDTLNLQKIHDYIESNGGGILYIPKSTIRITDTFLWNMAKVKIECDGKIFADINDSEKYSIVSRSHFNDNYNIVYENDLIKNEGIEIYGKTERDYKNNVISEGTCNGLLISNPNNVGSSRIIFKGLKIKNFKKGLTLGSNSYLNFFQRLSISNCDIGLITLQEENSGERYSFEDCIIYNNKKALEFNNEFATIYFYNSSIDYNYNKILQLNKGKVWINLCHIEHNEKHFEGEKPITVEQNDGNSLTISNSYIMFRYDKEIGYKKSHLIENKYIDNPFSGVTISNCFLQGCKTTSGFLATEGGINIFNNNSTYQWDTLPCFINNNSNHVIDGQVLNADLKYHSDFIITDGDERTEIGIKFNTWGDGDGGHSLMCKKTGNSKEFSEASIIVPIDRACKLLSAKLDLKASTTDTIDIYFGTCTLINGKIGYKNYIEKKGLIGVTNNAQAYNIMNGHQILINDPKATHVFISINMFNTNNQTEIYLKNIYIDQI